MLNNVQSMSGDKVLQVWGRFNRPSWACSVTSGLGGWVTRRGYSWLFGMWSHGPSRGDWVTSSRRWRLARSDHSWLSEGVESRATLVVYPLGDLVIWLVCHPPLSFASAFDCGGIGLHLQCDDFIWPHPGLLVNSCFYGFFSWASRRNESDFVSFL